METFDNGLSIHSQEGGDPATNIGIASACASNSVLCVLVYKVLGYILGERTSNVFKKGLEYKIGWHLISKSKNYRKNTINKG